MNNIHNWEKFNMLENNSSEKVYSLSELQPIEEWIESFWKKIGDFDEDKLMTIFNQIEDMHGEDVTKIIDGMFSAEKLHYHQNGKTSFTGGLDTGEFIRNFEEISSSIDDMI